MNQLTKLIQEQGEEFSEYLAEIHIKEYPTVLDDDLSDSFDAWIGEMDAEQMREYSETFIKFHNLSDKKAIIEKIIEMVDEKNCQVNYCQDGHLPLGMDADEEIIWGGCEECTVMSGRLEPFKTLLDIKQQLTNTLEEI